MAKVKIADRSTYWVSTGTNTPNSYGDYRYYWMIYYEQTDDNKRNNTSKIIVDQYLQVHFTESPPDDWMASGYTYYPSSSGNIAIDGTWQTAKSNAQGTIQLGDSYTLIYQTTYTKTISHNTDGTRSFKWQGTGFGKYTAVSTYTLPQILRPSIIGSVASFSIDNGVVLPITKYVSTYHDVLEILSGDEVLETIDGFTAGIETGVTVSIPVTFTEDELDYIYTQVPTGESATFTFKITTYKTSDKSSTIGTASSNITGNFTIVLPTVNGAICTDKIVNTPDWTGDTTNQTIIKGYSLVNVSIPVEQEAVANTRKATISKYIIENNTVAYNTSGVSFDLGVVNKDNVTIYAVDSRGTASLPYVQNFTNYIDYNPIAINTSNYEVVRCDEDLTENGVGEYIKAYVEGTWWQGNFGAVENKITTKVYYSNTENGDWTNDLDGFVAQASVGSLDESLIDVSTSGVFKYDGPIYSSEDGKKFDIEIAYDIAIAFFDEFSNLALTITVPYGKPAVAIYKNKAAFGAPYDESLGGTQMWGDVYLNGNPLSSIFPVGSIYMSVIDNDPGTLFGGEWERLQNMFLFGASDTHPAGEEGGAETVALTEAQLAKHGHPQNYSPSGADTNRMVTTSPDAGQWISDNKFGTSPGSKAAAQAGWVSSGGTIVGTGQTGSGEAHENMPPYLAVYMWKRIA